MHLPRFSGRLRARRGRRGASDRPQQDRFAAHGKTGACNMSTPMLRFAPGCDSTLTRRIVVQVDVACAAGDEHRGELRRAARRTPASLSAGHDPDQRPPNSPVRATMMPLIKARVTAMAKKKTRRAVASIEPSQ